MERPVQSKIIHNIIVWSPMAKRYMIPAGRLVNALIENKMIIIIENNCYFSTYICIFLSMQLVALEKQFFGRLIRLKN